MITLDMVKAGYEAGIINLINAEKMLGDGVACQIGDNWFYFGGQTAEEYSDVEKYKHDIPKDDIIQSIFEVLEQFSTADGFEDEYLYYESFLRENDINEKVLVNNSENFKPFRIAITETYVKEVEIYASDPVAAEQRAHDLCSAGEINLDFENFVERNTECRGVSRESDLKLHEVFGKDDEADTVLFEEKKEKKMKVIMVEPGKVACVKEVCAELEAMQQAVGGDIETMRPFEDAVAIVCNGEGKLIGLPRNRSISVNGEMVDIVVGNFFVCAIDGGDFVSLSDEQTNKYLKVFERPERFYRVGDQITSVKDMRPLDEIISIAESQKCENKNFENVSREER